MGKKVLPHPYNSLDDWIKPIVAQPVVVGCHTPEWQLVYNKSYRGALIQIWTHPEIEYMMHYHMQCCDVLVVSNYDFRHSTKPKAQQIEELIKKNHETFLEEAEEEKEFLQLHYREYRYGLQ